jgi:hypothetical protein
MRYPKLYFFNGSLSQRVRVNRLSTFFLEKAVTDGVFIENKRGRHKVGDKITSAINKVLEFRKSRMSQRESR